jgi:hypothetical protein
MALVAAVLCCRLAGAQPVGTAFTYQGRLTDAGNPAGGAYDLELALFDAASGGAQVGATLTRDDVVVSNGLFTIPLDFGAVFTGTKRWLEIRVRPGASSGAYTTLSGRQELTPSPNAVFSSAAPWTGVSGKPAGFADDTDNDALGALACPNGQIAKRVAGAWACQDDNAHDHLAQSWSGSSATGLSITNASGTALRGVSSGTAATTAAIQGEISGTNGSAVSGLAPAATGFGTGVFGQSGSRDGIGVRGDATATIGIATGVSGTSSAPDGRGVVGSGNYGVAGLSTSTRGRGIWGVNLASTGTTYGVYGETQSSNGFGGFFSNSSGGPAIGVSAGGIRFEDGSTQTTAAVGDITGVTAGTGLTGGAASGNATLNVSFGGSGTSNQAARANHDHIGNFWTGPGGLYLSNTDPGPPGFWNQGLYVEAIGSQTRAILGYATPSSGQNVGLWGQSDSTTGFGVLGYAPAVTGVNYGVYGRSDSPAGYAGFFEGYQVAIPNGKLTFAGPGPTRQLIDLRSPAYGIGQQGGVLYFRTEPPGGNFTWFLGGSHSDVQNDPGPGGFRQMRLDGGGNLLIRGSYFSGGADFAEMLAAERGLEPGDVLAIGP